MRERILKFENPHPQESMDLLANLQRLRAIVEETRRRGYGLQSGEFFDSEAGAGVPVMVDGVLRCCINVITARNAVSLEQLERQYVPKLQKAAARIAAAAGK